MNDKFYFQDKVVIITGASSGIGRAAALIFAQLNAKVVLGIKRNKAIVIVPAAYFLLGSLNSIFPRLADWAYRILKIEGEKIEK